MKNLPPSTSRPWSAGHVDRVTGSKSPKISRDAAPSLDLHHSPWALKVPRPIFSPSPFTSVPLEAMDRISTSEPPSPRGDGGEDLDAMSLERMEALQAAFEADFPLLAAEIGDAIEVKKQGGIPSPTRLASIQSALYDFPQTANALGVDRDGSSNQLNAILKAFGHEEKTAKNILIIGGGNIGLNLAKMLETNFDDIRIKIIEKNKLRADEIATELSSSIVLFLYTTLIIE